MGSEYPTDTGIHGRTSVPVSNETAGHLVAYKDFQGEGSDKLDFFDHEEEFLPLG